MSDTLAALHAAIIDNPADRTVRLVYADALDESGIPADAVRAEFIRAQIALKAMPDDDPQRPALATRCRELFAANWIDWWRPLCVALGLPEPHVPSRNLAARVKRFVGRDKREPGLPYVAYPDGYSLQSEEHGFTAQFIGGFPELVYFYLFPPGAGPELFGRWATAVPLVRLRYGPIFNDDESGEIVNGPHLAKVSELVFDRLSARAAAIVARSPHLKGLSAFKALPLEPSVLGVVRALVHNPTWAGLRSLTLNGTTSPDALRELAESCTLAHLEELTFGVQEVDAPNPFTDALGALGGTIAWIQAQIFNADPLPAGPINGPHYWPAFVTLARSPILPRLRRLRVLDTDPGWVERAAEVLTTTVESAAGLGPFLSDECVFAVADALDPDKLERLELPWTRLSPACRDELTRRFGSRVVLA